MADKRHKYSPQFKAEAVQMVVETDKPIAQVARDLGVVEQTLGNWVKAWRDANPDGAEALAHRACPHERAGRRESPAAMENEFLKNLDVVGTAMEP